MADRDIPPDEASTLDPAPKKTMKDFKPDKLAQRAKAVRKPEGGCVRVFVSPQWTLEYDLAASSLVVEVHQAITLASSNGEREQLMQQARSEVETWQKDGMDKSALALRVFQPLHKEEVSKAETAEQLALIIERVTDDASTFRARLPGYLVEAIEYVTSPLGEGKTEEPAA